MPWIAERAEKISRDRLQTLMQQTVSEARKRICAKPKRVLLLPPDITRMHSGSGFLTEMLFNLLKDEAEVHVIPTLGQHVPHTPDDNRRMFGSIPQARIHVHDWRDGCVGVGEISADFVKEVSGGAADWAMPIVRVPMRIQALVAEVLAKPVAVAEVLRTLKLVQAAVVVVPH